MKNYLIVGGSYGIGGAISRKLSDLNHHVTVVSRNKPQELSASVQHIAADVTKDSLSIEKLPDVIDGFVYAPGNIRLKPFHRLTHEAFQEDMEIHFFSMIRTIQAALPSLKKSNAGSIVLFSSVAVQVGMPFHTSISASKGAIEGFTRSLAADLSPGIRVNAVAPSLVDTSLASTLLKTDDARIAMENRHPLKKIGRPEEIADLIVFLLGEQAGWITGQVVPIDGGMQGIRK